MQTLVQKMVTHEVMSNAVPPVTVSNPPPPSFTKFGNMIINLPSLPEVNNMLKKSQVCRWEYPTFRRGGGIAQLLASLPTKQAVRVRFPLNPLVSERGNSISVLLTRSHQCQRLVQKRPSMCYYVCVIMHVKDP